MSKHPRPRRSVDAVLWLTRAPSRGCASPARRAIAASVLALMLYHTVWPIFAGERPAYATENRALYLDSDGGECTSNLPKPPPTTFSLTDARPAGVNPRCKDSGSINFAGGNPWAPIATWSTRVHSGVLSALDPLHVWAGLKNSDDQGTQFDLLAEVSKNGQLVAFGLARCVTGLTRNPSRATEIAIPFGSLTPTAFDGAADTLALKLSTRIGTTVDGARCPGPGGSHANARGLRVYYDAAAYASGFRASVLPGGDNPPVFASSPPTIAVELTPYSYDVGAQDPEGGLLTFQLVQGPSGMTIDTGTGRLLWIPQKGQAGAHPVQIRATDSAGSSQSQSFTLTVVAFNLDPTITSTPPTFVRVGQDYLYDADAHDPESGAITFAFAESPPAGMTIDPVTGMLRWSPPAAAVGSHRIALSATDPLGAVATQVFGLDVIEAGADLQIVSPTGTHALAVGQTLTLPLQANDARAAFSAEPMPANAAITGSTFTFTPATAQEGTHTVAFRARLADMVRSTVVRFSVTRGNAAPQFAPIAAQSVAEGGSLAFTIQASDPDGDPLQYSAPGLGLPNAFFNTLTRQFSFFPAAGQAGNHQVSFAVSDGRASSQLIVSVQVTAGPGGGAQILDLSVDPPQNPTFATTQAITGSTTGLVGPPPPAERPAFVTGLVPSSIKQGQAATVDIAGLNTAFAQGGSRADFGEGVTVESLTVLSPTSARASIRADRLAGVGPRQVRMQGAGADVPAVVAFSVEPGTATITGVVLDPFTQQPLVGVTVTIQGTNLSVTTDAQGRFTLSGVAPGSVTVVVTLPNYGVQQLRLAVGTNDSVTLAEPIALDALARPPSLGGTLLRAASVPSVLDRGVTDKGGRVTFEQAKALISDTLVAIGGIEVGVVDESGRQLNPRVTGHGEMSLTPQGVAQHARALLRGDVLTLREFFDMLKGSFRFAGGFMLADLLAGLQDTVAEAWADPGNPLSGMPIVLFNEGPTLLPIPPRITGDTRLNSFQAFLLLSSFLVFFRSGLQASAEQLLDANGVPFDSLLPRTAQAARANPAALATAAPGSGASLAAPGVLREAGPGLDCKTASEHCRIQDLFAKQSFRHTWKKIGANMIVEAGKGALIGAGFAFAFAIVTGTLMGGLGPGGLAAATLTIVAGATLGALAVLTFVLVLGWYIALAAAAASPEPVLAYDSVRDPTTGDLVITFGRSATEVQVATAPPPEPGTLGRSHTYHLYRFEGCREPAQFGLASYMSLKATADLTDPANLLSPPRGRLRFTVPKADLITGPNHFRIVTFQYVHAADQPLFEGLAPYDTDQDGVLSEGEWIRGGLGLSDFRSADGRITEDGRVTLEELARHHSAMGNQLFPAGIEIFPGKPQSPTIQRFLGNPGLDPLTYEATRAADRVVLNNSVLAFEALPTTTAQIYQQEGALIRELNQQYKIKTTPDLDLFVNNAKALDAVDQIDAQATAQGRRAVTTVVEKTPDGRYIGQFATEGEAIATRVYAEHLGRAPTPEQVRLVQQAMETQRTLAIAERRATPLHLQVEEITRLTHGVKNGTIIELNFRQQGLSVPTPSTAQLASLDPEIFKLTPTGNGIQGTVTPDNKAAALAKLNELSFDARVKLGGELAFAGHVDGDTGARGQFRQAIRASMFEAISANTDGLVTPAEAEARIGRFVNQAAERHTRAHNLLGRVNESQAQLQQVSEHMKAVQRTGTAPGTSRGPVGNFHVNLQEATTLAASSRTSLSGGFSGVSNTLGAVLTGSSALLTYLESIKVLVSEFSECYTGFGGDVLPPEQFPPSFVIFPDDTEVSAIVRAAVEGPKQGSLKREYPGDDDRVSRADAMFPPGLLTLDAKGRILALNTASAEHFGGRIFRFQPKPTGRRASDGSFQLDRELVGAVGYYSLELSTGKPTRPVAMVALPPFAAVTETGKSVKTQDLLVANRNIKSEKAEILRVPISLLDIRPSVYPGGGGPRHRIAGRKVAEFDSPLTGPSDMVVGPDPASETPVVNQNSVIMFSDEGRIYALTPAVFANDYVLRPVIENAERRFSGLAFDPMGNFYFADYDKGDVFVMSWTVLREALAADTPLDGDLALQGKAFPVARGLIRPGKLQVEVASSHPGGVLLASTAKGIQPLAMPIVGSLGSTVIEVRIKRIQKEEAVVVDTARRIFRAVPSREDLEEKKAYLVVRRRNADGRESTHTVTVQLDDGATIVDKLE